MSKLIDFGPYVATHATQQPHGFGDWTMQLEHNAVAACFELAAIRKHMRHIEERYALTIMETGFVTLRGWWCDAHPILERIARTWAKFDQPHYDEYHWAVLRG